MMTQCMEQLSPSKIFFLNYPIFGKCFAITTPKEQTVLLIFSFSDASLTQPLCSADFIALSVFLTRAQACTHTHIYAHTHLLTQTHIHVHRHVHAHTQTHTDTHTHRHMHTHTHTHIHTRTHACTHARTHTHRE